MRVNYYVKVIVGKGLVFLTKRKGLSNSMMKGIVMVSKGFVDYDFVHAGVRELAAPGANAPVRLSVQSCYLYSAQYSASVPPGACWAPRRTWQVKWPMQVVRCLPLLPLAPCFVVVCC